MGVYRDRADNVMLLLELEVEAIDGHLKLAFDFTGDLLLVFKVCLRELPALPTSRIHFMQNSTCRMRHAEPDMHTSSCRTRHAHSDMQKSTCT